MVISSLGFELALNRMVQPADERGYCIPNTKYNIDRTARGQMDLACGINITIL
jgi:hypothetical protein